jgi:CheY-like chemotaxis protein
MAVKPSDMSKRIAAVEDQLDDRQTMHGLRNIPVFAATSYALNGDKAQAIVAGCEAYFAKPVSLRSLSAKIRECSL